jgi:hypothetical protein
MHPMKTELIVGANRTAVLPGKKRLNTEAAESTKVTEKTQQEFSVFSAPSVVKRFYQAPHCCAAKAGGRIQRAGSFQANSIAILSARASADGHRNHSRSCRAFQFQRLHDESKFVGAGS